MTPFKTLPLALLLAAAAVAPATAQARRPTAQEQEAQALARLSLPDLRNYFEARRQIERRSSDLRLAQLRNLEDCLQRTRQRHKLVLLPENRNYAPIEVDLTEQSCIIEGLSVGVIRQSL